MFCLLVRDLEEAAEGVEEAAVVEGFAAAAEVLAVVEEKEWR